MDFSKTVLDYIKDTSNEIKTMEGSFSASQMLERFLFDKKMQYTPIGRLSGGERRRLYLLKVLISAPNILFLDEPTNDLDIETLQILEDYLDNFNGAIITVSHDRYFLDRICDKMFVFEENGVIRQYTGGYSALKLEQSYSKEKTEKEKTVRQSIPKMSTKEKQELESMDQKMDDIQNKIQSLDEEMALAGDDFKKIQQLSDTRMNLENELEKLMERWEELSEKKQMIEDMKNK